MSPVLPKRPRLSDQPTPKNWFDLPLEMHDMVIDKMDAKTRCKFAQCSKICEFEAKRSKKYLNKIQVSQEYSDDKELYLHVAHNEKDSCNFDFWFEFIDITKNQTVVVYRSGSGENAKWSKIESGKPEVVRMRYSEDYIKIIILSQFYKGTS